MLSLSMYFKYVAVMAAVTYLLRALPFVLVKKKITNIYIRSFHEYHSYLHSAPQPHPMPQPS